jgi:aminocarboxymuconate-semialdehyde decarboxylase
MKIDVHNHVIPKTVLDLLNSDRGFGVVHDGKIVNVVGQFEFPFTDSMCEPDAKIEELAKHGLEAAVLSIAPPTFLYHLDAARSEAVCEAANDGMAAFAAAQPRRFRWMAHVPMRAPERAADMLRRAKNAGAVGVEIATNIVGERLDEARFDPFWSAADELGLPVMIHPWYNAPNPGLDEWYFQNVIGNPLETMTAACRLICAGTLDRFARVQILLVHGGGHLPYQLGRLRHAASVREELKDAPKDPWSYAGRLKFDCLTHDAKAAAFLIDRAGVDNVFMGTDLPFDMAPTHPTVTLDEAVGKTVARQVLETNAAKYFHFA